MRMEEVLYDYKVINIFDLVKIFFKHVRLFLIVFFTFIFVCLLYIGLHESSYTATATISIDSLSNLTAWNAQRTETKAITSELQYLINQNTLLHALEALDLSSYTYKNGTDYQDLLSNKNKLKVLRESIRTSAAVGTNSVTITIKHSNALFVQDLLSALVSTYDKYLLELSNIRLTIDRDLLQKQLIDTEKRLKEAKLSLDSFQKGTDIVLLEANRGIYQQILTLVKLEKSGILPVISITELYTYLESLGLSTEMIQNRLQQYQSTYKTYIYDTISHLLVIDNTSNTELETRNPVLAQALVSMELAIKDLLISIGLIDTDAIKLLFQIGNTIKYSILSEEESYYLSQIQAYTYLEQEYSELKNAVNRENNELIRITNLLKTFDAFLAIPKSPTLFIEDVRLIDEKGESGNLSILLIGVFLSVVLASLFVFLTEFLSDSIADEQVLKRITRKEILLLPIIPEGSTDLYTNLELLRDPKSKVSNTFDQLAAILLYSEKRKVYSISSVNDDEGTSCVIINIALSLLKKGRRVLLISANSNGMRYKKYYANICANEEMKNLVQMNSLDIEHPFESDCSSSGLLISIIDVAENKLSKVLHSQQFEKYIEYSSNSFDLILIDGPTFKASSDFLLIAKIADGVILNVRTSIGSRKQLKNLIYTLELCKIPLLGIILNNYTGKLSRKELGKKLV